MDCKVCKNFWKCIEDANRNGCEHNPDFEGEKYCRHFVCYTNGDKIRAMSDEELIAMFVLEDKCPPQRYSSRKCDGFDSCKDCWIDWLQQPAEGE